VPTRANGEEDVPPITFLGYKWVEKEVRTFFSSYNDILDIINLLSWLPISTIRKDEHCPITLWMVRLDATPPPEFVFMNKDFFICTNACLDIYM